MYIFHSYNILNLQVINIINFPLCITSSRTYSLNPGPYPTTIRSRATPGLSELSPKPGFSRTVRPLFEAGLLPDCPNDPRSRAAPGLSGYSPKAGFPSLPRLCKAFLRRQERIYLIITILTYRKTSSLRTHTPDTNTYDTLNTLYGYISSY